MIQNSEKPESLNLFCENSEILVILKTMQNLSHHNSDIPTFGKILLNIEKVDIAILSFFIPQLISWQTKTHNLFIENFLLCCTKNYKFAIKFLCYLDVIIKQTNLKEQKNYALGLYEKCDQFIKTNYNVETESKAEKSYYFDIGRANSTLKQSLQREPSQNTEFFHTSKTDFQILPDILKNKYKNKLVLSNSPIRTNKSSGANPSRKSLKGDQNKHSAIAKKLNSAQTFFRALEKISLDLGNLSPSQKPLHLRLCLEKLNREFSEQKIFPLDLNFLHHSEVNSFCSEKSVCLPSKNSSPFLFHLDITKIGHCKSAKGQKAKEGKTPSFIYKNDPILRQEVMAMQLISVFKNIWDDAGLPLRLTVYDVFVTSVTGGVIKAVPNAVSIDKIKKQSSGNLWDFFKLKWSGDELKSARKNFVESMAAYSLVTYILQIKDRHNGNILIDDKGGVVHIDFGYFLSNSPGRNVNFESIAFKLTSEHVDVMNGKKGAESYDYFKLLMIRGFLEARKYWDSVEVIVSLMEPASSSLPCFRDKKAVENLRDRFCITKSDEECIEHVSWLIEESLDNWRTEQYDAYQRITNGIL